MYITQEVLNQLEQKYGVPRTLRTAYTMGQQGFDFSSGACEMEGHTT